MASRDRPRRISVIVWPPTLPARAPTTMAGGQSTQQIALAMMPRPHPDADRQWNSLTWPPLRSIRAASTSCEDEDSADSSKASQSARASANIRYAATVTLIVVNFSLLFRSEDRDSQPLATRAEELSPWTVGRSRVRGIGHFGRLPGSEGPFRMILQTAGEVAARQVRSTIASWRRPVDFSYCSADANRLHGEMPAAPAGVGSSSWWMRLVDCTSGILLPQRHDPETSFGREFCAHRGRTRAPDRGDRRSRGLRQDNVRGSGVCARRSTDRLGQPEGPGQRSLPVADAPRAHAG